MTESLAKLDNRLCNLNIWTFLVTVRNAKYILQRRPDADHLIFWRNLMITPRDKSLQEDGGDED